MRNTSSEFLHSKNSKTLFQPPSRGEPSPLCGSVEYSMAAFCLVTSTLTIGNTAKDGCYAKSILSGLIKSATKCQKWLCRVSESSLYPQIAEIISLLAHNAPLRLMIEVQQ
jgi:hypothetical protein